MNFFKSPPVTSSSSKFYNYDDKGHSKSPVFMSRMTAVHEGNRVKFARFVLLAVIGGSK